MTTSVRYTLIATSVASIALLSACGGSNSTELNASSAPQSAFAAPSASASPTVVVPKTANEIADAMNEVLPTVFDVVYITEDNDSNHLIGRPTGYTSAAVLQDKRFIVKDDPTSVDNGATIEVFETPEAANKRRDYILDIGANASFLSQYAITEGTSLLRAAGKMKPSQFATYEVAFKDAVGVSTSVAVQASNEERAYAACKTADDTAEATGDKTYAGIRPINPQWPPLSDVSVKVYDTGVYDLSGTASGAPWSCLWTEKVDGAKIAWAN